MNPILQEIQESFRILTYEESWDDEGASSFEDATFIRAMSFIYSLLNYTSSNIETPEINPCIDGSIDFSWRTEDKSVLLVNVRRFDMSYYGCTADKASEINETVVGPIDFSLFDWIAENLGL